MMGQKEVKKKEMQGKKECYCITLCRAEGALTAFYDEHLRGLGITVKQYCLLTNLDEMEEANAGELAVQVNLERSTLTRNIKLLQSKGWIYDRAEAGRRPHRYALTQEGQQVVLKARQIWDQTQEEVEKIIGEEDLPGFLEILHKLRRLGDCKTLVHMIK